MADAALPEGWAAYQDPENRTYYANAATGETAWEPPAVAVSYAPAEQVQPPYVAEAGGLPDGWAAYQDNEGRTYYANAATGETAWEPPAAAPQPEATPAVASGAAPQWSVDYTYTIGQVGCEDIFQHKAQVLDANVHTSVMSTVDALNAGGVHVPAGYCVMFSKSKEKYFLLWREDKGDEAFAQLGIQEDGADTYWAIEQVCNVGHSSERHRFEGKAEILDESRFNSVQVAIDALNAGQIASQDGFCICFSGSQDYYFLIWRSDKQAEAYARLGLPAAGG